MSIPLKRPAHPAHPDPPSKRHAGAGPSSPPGASVPPLSGREQRVQRALAPPMLPALPVYPNMAAASTNRAMPEETVMRTEQPTIPTYLPLPSVKLRIAILEWLAGIPDEPDMGREGTGGDSTSPAQGPGTTTIPTGATPSSGEPNNANAGNSHNQSVDAGEYDDTADSHSGDECDHDGHHDSQDDGKDGSIASRGGPNPTETTGPSSMTLPDDSHIGESTETVLSCPALWGVYLGRQFATDPATRAWVASKLN